MYLPYSLYAGNLRSEHLLNRNLKSRQYTDSQLLADSWWGRLMLRLSLDKFDLLFSAAILGKLYLVGNRLFTNTVQHRNLVKELPVYNPGVFSLSESIANPIPDTEIFVELEYIDKISTIFNLKIFFKSILGRLFLGLGNQGKRQEANK